MKDFEENKEKHIEQLFTNPEPWEKWESSLVFYSILTAVVSLVILAILINWLIL